MAELASVDAPSPVRPVRMDETDPQVGPSELGYMAEAAQALEM